VTALRDIADGTEDFVTDRQVLEIDAALDPPLKDLVVPGRFFLRQTEMQVWDDEARKVGKLCLRHGLPWHDMFSQKKKLRPQQLLLFTDAILLATKEKEKLKPRALVPLKEAEVFAKPDFRSADWGFPEAVQKSTRSHLRSPSCFHLPSSRRSTD
jgi:hypothetical protein